MSGADALANLPNLGKVVTRKGMRPFGNKAGRADCQHSSVTMERCNERDYRPPFASR